MPYPVISTERGRLYYYLCALGGPRRKDYEFSILFLWSDRIATFQEFLDEFEGSGRGSYKLRLDSRSPQDIRCGKPGYFVFGNPDYSAGIEETKLVGVFIPEGTEKEVVEKFRSSMGPTLLLPKTLSELAFMIPGSILENLS